MAMKLGKAGQDLIKHFEGLRLTAYKCPAGVWTIGWGHTAGVKKGDVITEQQAQKLFESDMVIYENYVNKLVKQQLNQNQFDALVSFCYNCGPANLQKLIKNRTLEQIAETMLLYNKGGGVVLLGLVRRRKMERDLFLTPVKPEKSNKYQVTAHALNIRAGVGTTYKIVGCLKHGDIVQVTQIKDNWGKINKGWISLKYTKNLK